MYQAYILNGKKHDVKFVRKFTLSPGSIVALDPDYSDFII
jgi:hypothetical protein